MPLDREDSDWDTRSTDGEDSAGSLVDFIVESGEDEEEAKVLAAEGEVDANDFPYDEAVLRAHMARTPGPRRSLRNSRVPVRYVDERMRELMYSDASTIADESSDAEPGDATNDSDYKADEDAGSEDGDYDEGDDNSDSYEQGDDEEKGDDEEEKEKGDDTGDEGDQNEGGDEHIEEKGDNGNEYGYENGKGKGEKVAKNGKRGGVEFLKQPLEPGEILEPL